MTDPAVHDESLKARLLWSPAPASYSLLKRFIDFVEERAEKRFDDYASLHAWSINEKDLFWDSVWDFCGLKGDKGNVTLEKISQIPYGRFYPDGTISYAENSLSYGEEYPDDPAIIARTQDGPDRVITWQNLRDHVSLWEQALIGAGIKKGDRVAVYLPNIPETVMVLLAASNIGAVFSSAGMEMGASDLISRFSQVKPKIMITADGYVHGEKLISRMEVIAEAKNALPSLETMVVIPLINGTDLNVRHLDHCVTYQDFLGPYDPQPLSFNRHSFNHPLYILFSSGTTGKPKCFEHASGGVLLKHVCEMKLNSDIREGDVLFYHATPSWMMWNWLVSGLACGATILMYDGSPYYPDAYAQWDFTVSHNCTHHGTAAPIILSWAGQDMKPVDRYDLSSLRVVFSTGAVLPDQGFTYIHEYVKNDIKISSISGGTDIVGSFLGGNPMTPTYAGQLNAPLLGMDVRVWNEQGAETDIGEAGELVCKGPFPSMPLRFLNDPDGARYADEYFSYYPSRKAWRHGDSIVKTPEGQFMIIGRSDATLNQNGVRIGASAIYKQLEEFSDQITDAAAVDFIRPDNRQSLTVLFLVMPEGHSGPVPESLQIAIKQAVKVNVTPYAVPTEIVAVSDVLETPNGKKAEVVMKKAINGKDIPNPSLYGADLVEMYQRIGQDLTAKYSG